MRFLSRLLALLLLFAPFAAGSADSPNIFISEVMPSPDGPDAQEEWIEIFNKNSFEIDLSGWQIADIAGATKTYIFPQGTKIVGQGFLLLTRPQTKITLNNDGDGVQIINQGDIIDSVGYSKAPQGQSYSRKDAGWFWTEILTPGAENIIHTAAAEPKTEPKEEKTYPQQEEPQQQEKENALAAISSPILLEEDSFECPVFLLALALALLSGAVILVLKKKLSDKVDISKQNPYT